MRMFLLALALFFPGATLAQDIGGGFLSAGIGNTGIEAVNQQIEEVVEDQGSVAIAVDADFSFTSDPARTARNLQSFVERTRPTDPVAAAQLQSIFEQQPQLVQEVGVAMRRFGLDPHDVADAYALWWISAWTAANLDRDTPSLQAIAAVREQARTAMYGVHEGILGDDAVRQRYAEALIVQAALLDTALEQSEGNAAAEAEIVRATLSGAAASGLDLSSMTLTDGGFEPR